MSKFDHARAKVRDTKHRVVLTTSEMAAKLASDTASIIKGMGHGPRHPCKRISPNSPEGRAIAARYTAQPP